MNSSTYSGLPPAWSQIACCTSAGGSAVPSRLEISRAVSAAVNARRFTRAALRAEAAHPGARSYSSGRAVPTSSSGTPSA